MPDQPPHLRFPRCEGGGDGDGLPTSLRSTTAFFRFVSFFFAVVLKSSRRPPAPLPRSGVSRRCHRTSGAERGACEEGVRAHAIFVGLAQTATAQSTAMVRLKLGLRAMPLRPCFRGASTRLCFLFVLFYFYSLARYCCNVWEMLRTAIPFYPTWHRLSFRWPMIIETLASRPRWDLLFGQPGHIHCSVHRCVGSEWHAIVCEVVVPD